MKKFAAVLLLMLLLLPTSAHGLPGANTSAPASAANLSMAESRTLTLLAAGDNLIHDVIYHQARRRSNGSYDFTPAYSAVAPIIRAADIAVINQETILASDVAEPSNYPRFCTPTVLGEQLIEIGFDVFTQANNHSYDQGAVGIRACMDFWDNHPQALAVGMYRSDDERNAIRYTEVNGIRLAFLAATEHTNGLTLPTGSTEGVWLLSDTTLLAKKLAEARKNADFVVLSPHWGNEGSSRPTEEQRRMAALMVQWGADLVLGTHPHVLQPCETVNRADGSQGLVIYSLGNFISAQQGKGNMAGGLLEVTVEQNGENHAVIAGHRLIPTVTQYGAGYANLRVLPFADYTPQLAATHGVHQYTQGFGMEYLTQLYRSTYPDCAVLGGEAPTVKLAAGQAVYTAFPAAVPPGGNAAADTAMDAICTKNNVVGMSVAAFKNQQVVYTHSYGLANVEKKIPAAENTIYRTASIAKPITTMVALVLYDDGSIDLDGDISQHIGFPVRNPKYPDNMITPRQLMTHTGSVIDSGGYYDAIGHTPFCGLSQLMHRNIFTPYPPGEIYIYSNLSAGMVGSVAAGQANEHLWSLSQRRLFVPLGIGATYLSKSIPDQNRIAAIYSGSKKTFDPIADGTAESYYKRIPPGEQYMLGHGDLYLTASDLARLGMVLAGDGLVGNARILKRDTVQMMNAMQFHVNPKSEGIPEIFRGLGVQIFPQLLPGRSFAGHQGNAYGMMGCLLYEPEKGTGVAFLTNGCHTGQRDGVVYDINREVADTLYTLILDPIT
ncbi:MAG: CapA family protein [Angelakisella sp.]